MCRKLILLTSFVLVLGFVNNANAADIVWTGLGADNLWSNPANWEGNKVPTAADDVAVEVPGAAAPNGPLIQDGIDAECGVLWNEVAGEPTMTMTGGTLTISGWGIWWGDGPGCNPTFYQSGGTIDLTGGPGIHEFGWGGASGTWIMTGGTVNAKGISIPSGAGNSGTIYLHGGTYNVGTERGGLVMRENGLIDITEGTFILEGDETAKINDLIAAGQITAYGGAGQFEIDFDVRNPGSTTVTAVEEGKAYNPAPADGALYEDIWATLNWSPTDAAASHDIYFGEDFDSVNDGTGDTFRGNQTDTFFIVGLITFPYPDGLVPGTTYYWRIDEVEADDTIHKGDVWSFTVPPRTAYDPNPADGAEFIDLNVELSWTAGLGAMSHTVYFGDNFDDVNNDTGGDSIGDTTYSPGTLELEKVYYWRVDEYDAIDTYKGDVWSFTTPGAVGSPNPSNGTTGVKMTATLSWTPGDSAASHEIYFGTDKDAVRNADTASPEEYKGTRNLGSESYDPGKLEWLTTYYWRVDEVNNVNPNSLWKGPLWSFTTADFLIVDDFESYNDLDPNDPGSNRIFNTWKDGLYVETNGSVVGYAVSPFAEQSIVHGGNQSMPYFYDNDFKYSEANLPLSPPQDWTEEGVEVLSLWFRGDASNAAELMYVAVSNADGTPAVVSHDDPNAAQINIWTEWTIDLQAFADQGVDLTSVSTIAIGFGDKNNVQAGGSGKVYFDDIRLYQPAPEPEPDWSPVAIVNPGFEDPVLGEDDWTWLDVPGWTWVGGEGPGIWHVTSANFDPVVAPEGQNVLYTENAVGDAGGVAQVLTDTFAANIDYTLTVEVGNSWEYYWSGYSVQLLVGGVVIAEDNNTLWPDYMLWDTSTVEYTYDPGDSGLVGQPLEIRLLNLGIDMDVAAPSVVGVEFDNIRLYRPELTVEVLFVDDFESYAAGDALHGVGGWAGWGGDAGAGAPVSDAFAFSGTNSVEVVGTADLVQEFDIAGGTWTFSAMQYIPSGTTGKTYFILLNQYGETNDWSTQTSFDLAAGTLTFWNGETATILYDQWVELKLVIDLDNNTVDEYYNGELISTHQWDDDVHGTLGALDLYSEGASSIYYDDITISRP